MRQFIFMLLTMASTQLTLEASKKIDFYLLIGQSNMAGRATLGEQDMKKISNCVLLNQEGNWEAAINPLNRYSTIRKGLGMQKLGPGYTFGEAMAKQSQNKIGLIVNAKGGSSIQQWRKGGHFFNNAIERVKQAEKTGTLRGVLWHQGETDHKNSNYMHLLKHFIINLRAALNKPDLPFVAGQINNKKTFNNALLTLPNLVPNTSVVLSKELTTQDYWHFDNKSSKELGRRYAIKMQKLIKK